MKLDDLARTAVTDLLDASAAQADGGLADLQRRRRRSALVRGACAVAVVVLVAGGLALVNSSRGRHVQPAEPDLGVTNGALLGFPAAARSTTVKVLAGAPPADGVLERLLTDVRRFGGVLFSPDGTELRHYEPESGRIVTVDLESGRRRTAWQCTDDAPLCSGWAALSPNEQLVAHLRGFGNPRLEVTDLSTGKRVVYRPGEWRGPMVWSPDSAALAVATAEGITIVQPGVGSRVLVPLDLQHGGMAPSWSPDGTHLAYVEPHSLDNPKGWTSFSLVIANTATGAARTIRDLGRCVCKSLFPPQVAWSPDGELIATSTITSRSLQESGQVLLIRADGSAEQQVGVNENLTALLWQPVPVKP